jgi:hypothetical protein
VFHYSSTEKFGIKKKKDSSEIYKIQRTILEIFKIMKKFGSEK